LCSERRNKGIGHKNILKRDRKRMRKEKKEEEENGVAGVITFFSTS
jgi:hypothetical protein